MEEEPKESFNKNNLKFNAFRRIMEQYDPTMNEGEVARTYREAFIAGN